MQISVKHAVEKKMITVDVSRENKETVLDLKNKIFDKTGILVEEQIMFLKGKTCENSCLINDLELGEGNITLAVKKPKQVNILAGTLGGEKPLQPKIDENPITTKTSKSDTQEKLDNFVNLFNFDFTKKDNVIFWNKRG